MSLHVQVCGGTGVLMRFNKNGASIVTKKILVSVDHTNIHCNSDSNALGTLTMAIQ
jgi:hypothetical protein